MRVTLLKAAGTVVFLAGWELICRLKLVNPIILAGPTDIVTALLHSGPDFFRAFQVTLLSIVVAAALAWCVGLGVGLIIGLSPFRYAVFAPLLTGLFAIPLIMVYPLFLVWFGIGPSSQVAFAVTTASIPIALNTMDGVRQIDRQFIKLARSIGASSWQAYTRIYLPLSLPSILSGLRIGTSLVVIGVIVCEMLASADGLGFWISYNRTLFNTGEVYLGIVFAMACVVLVNYGIGYVEHRFAAARRVMPRRRIEADR